MSDLTIRHTRADGTLIEGSAKGDGVYELLRGLRANWRYFPSLGQLGIGQSRDKAAQTWRINTAAEALRAAGHTVTVEIDETQRRTFAEAEAERVARAQGRADYHAEKAERRTAEAEARWQAERQILDFIPPGQPILVGHHSERRHRRDLARADAHARAGLAALRTAEHHEHRAEAAANYQRHREDPGTTQRRIAKLEAEERQIRRRLDGTGHAIHGEDKPAAGGYRERLEGRAADVAEELAYWRGVLDASGAKVWTRADFAKGDFVMTFGTWVQVLRVNPKSVTIAWGVNFTELAVLTRENSRTAIGPSTWTRTLPYDKVTARKPADDPQIAALLAAQERQGA